MDRSGDDPEGLFGAAAADEAFELTFSRYYPLVYRLAYRYVGAPDEAEDIAQEVFLRLYHLPPQAGSLVQRRAWLCRVAINLGLNAVRQRKRSIAGEGRMDACEQERTVEAAQAQDPEQLVLAREQAALVRSILAQLPERQQVCLLLRSIGFSYEDIAEATGIPLTSIGSVLARAIRAFRRSYHE